VNRGEWIRQTDPVEKPDIMQPFASCRWNMSSSIDTNLASLRSHHSNNVSMAGVGDGLRPDPWMALYCTPQHDVVEADDEDTVGRAHRLEQARHSIDSEVRPFGLLDLEQKAISSRFAHSSTSATVGTRVRANRELKPARASRLRIRSRHRSAAKPRPSVVRSSVRSWSTIGSSSAVSTTSISTVVAPQALASEKAGIVFSG